MANRKREIYVKLELDSEKVKSLEEAMARFRVAYIEMRAAMDVTQSALNDMTESFVMRNES